MSKKNVLKTNSKSIKVYKNKKINKANFGNFTLNDYQVYLLLISKLGFSDKFGRYTQPEVLQREHTLTAKEFSSVYGVSLQLAYKTLKEAVDKLIKTDVTTVRPEVNEIWRINVCSMAKYCENEGRITIKFTDDILPYLSQQINKRFLFYNLKDVTMFRSLYATRLFELINEFKYEGWMLKDIHSLKTILNIDDHLYKRYVDFKRRVISSSVKEINKNHPHLCLTFEEIKDGRAVQGIKFVFNAGNKKELKVDINYKTLVLDKRGIVYYS